VPAEKYGLQVISMGFLTQDDAPIIWRGPMLHGALQQFFREVAWSNLDYLVVDLPPGTGDVALSLSQTVPVAGAIVVTTPQQVSLADSRRAIAMYKKLNIPTLASSRHTTPCPSCGTRPTSWHGGGERWRRISRAVRRADPIFSRFAKAERRPHYDQRTDRRRAAPSWAAADGPPRGVDASYNRPHSADVVNEHNISGSRSWMSVIRWRCCPASRARRPRTGTRGPAGRGRPSSIRT